MSLEQESLERVLVLSENTILCEGLKGIARKVISWNLVGEHEATDTSGAGDCPVAGDEND